jgi:Cadherin domain/Bacterial Ig domain/Bacterial cadherin-like domain
MRRLFAVVAGVGLLAIVATAASAAPTFRATASMTPQVQYLNDTTGTVFTFTVINIGDTPFAAVDIARPSPSWVVKTCPLAPAGWTTERHVWGCRFRSRVTASDDIPGHSSNANFRVKATVRAGSENLVGRWRVVVSRTRSFSLARDLRSAPPLTPGLRMVAHSFQVLNAVVVPSPLAIGSACPAPTAANHSAITGSTGHTVAICGRNRTTAARTPGAGFSSLGGTFVASHGGFASGSIRANSGNVVLGNWSNVTITSSAGAGKTIAAKIGSSAVRTSPVTTLSGYTATNEPPVAAAGSASTNEDTASGPITLSASDPNGDPIAFSIASGPAHGTLSAISAAACPSTAPAAHTCTATVVYTPAVNYNGPDSFTYIATDTFAAASAPATVSITVNQVNDAPVVNPATFTVFENRPNGTFIGTVTSSDADTGQTRTYSIQAGNTGGAFAIIGSTGAITVANSTAVDFETNPTFSLTIRATDNGSPPSFGEATVTVNLLNINDAPTLNAISDPAAILEDAGEQNQALGGISAGAGESQTLVVTAISSNPGLIPNPTVTYTSPNATGSLAYTPVANQSGSAVITVNVGDNGGTANGGVNTFSRAFTVTVTPVNDHPVVFMTVTDLVYTEGDGAVVIDSGLTVTDPDSTIQGAAVWIQEPAFDSAEDELGFTNQNGIFGSYDDSTGVLTLTGTASVANYQAALRSVRYANSSDNPSGTKIASFQVTDSSGGASTEVIRDIDLYGVNDAPVVTTSVGSTAYTEGAAGVAIDGSLTVADPDDTNIESGQVRVSSNFQSGDDLIFVNQNGISGVYNTGTGVLTLTGTASKADYQTALRSILFATTQDNPAASKTVEFKLNDGDADSAAATKNIAVTGANDAPTVEASSGTASYTEDGSPAVVDPGLTVSDPDSTQLQAATVNISANFSSADGDSLNFTNQNGITGTYNGSTGVLALSGTATLANYQTALRSITFSNTSDTPSTTTRTVSFQVTDSGGAPSASDSRDVTVAVANDAPVVATTGGASVYEEGDPASTVDDGLTVTDPDDTNIESGQVRISSGFDTGDDLVFVNQNGISGVYNTGTGVLTLTGTASKADYQTGLRSIQFQTTNTGPTASKTVEFKVNDGSADSNPATKTINVTPTNSPPDVTATATALSYNEGDGAVAADNGLTVTDPDSTQIQGATVAISGSFVSADDELAFADIGPITGAYNDTTGVLTLSGTDTVANYQAALRTVTYENDSDNPSGAKTLSFQVTDDGGEASNVATRTVNLTGVNDAPTLATSIGNAAYTEGGAAVTVDGSIVVADVDDTNIESGRVRISSGFDAGDDLVFINQNGISGVYNTGTGVLTLTGTSTLANYQTALRSITFQGTDDTPTESKTVEFKVNDGDADSDLATKGIDVTPTNDAPVADDESFSGAIGNTTFVVDDPSDAAPSPSAPKKTISGSILAGDTDPDGPGPLVVIAGNFYSDDGGTVAVEADGDFVFQPAAGTSCSDSSDYFDYTVSDQYPGTFGWDNGRVTITYSDCVWYVDNNDPTGNSGTSTAPFDTLAQAETASGTDDYIFVYDGDNTSTGYNTGFAMKAGQRLIGESEGLVVGSDALLAANPGATPSLTANDEDVIDLDDGNEVRGFNIDPQGTGGGIAGSTGDTGGGTISNVHINDVGTVGQEPGLDLFGTTGTFNISNLEIDNSDTGVKLFSAGTVNFLSAGTISINSTTAKALDAFNTSFGTSVFDDITVTSSPSGGIDLLNTTGAITFSNLDLTTTSGDTPAFRLQSVGSVTVVNAGTANVSATGGPAIDVTSASGAALLFDTVSSTNSTGNGIRISGLGTGTFSASGGTISGVGAAGTSFVVSGSSSGDITYPGTLGNGAGQAVSITGRTGGTIMLSGPVQDTNDVGGGITISGNTGGSTIFSNAQKDINTTTSGGGGNPINNAVVFSASDGHTLSFTNGGLNIDTSVGRGVDATTSGILNIVGSSNTIDSTTGTALRISDTDIGGSGVTFEHVASNGAVNGIVLNNTGAVGNLVVTGNAGTCTSAATCTGGAIQNSTVGISLTSTLSPTFDQMAILNSTSHGISGTDVTNFTFTDGKIDNSGTGGGVDTANIAFNTVAAATENNVDGVVTITGNTLTNARYHGIDIFNFSGTITDANISNNTITSSTSTAASSGAGIRWVARGAAANAADITKGTLNNNIINNFPSGVGLQVQCGNANNEAAPAADCGTAGSATNIVNITNNKINGSGLGSTVKTGAEGMIALVNGVGQGNFNITGNEVRQNTGTSISSSAFGDAIVTETIGNNTIVSNNTVGSQGVGIGTSTTGGFATNTPNMTATLSGNNVSQTDGNGILAVARDSSAGVLKVKVLNNVVAAPLAGVRQGIRIDAGNTVGADNDVCAQISGNTSAPSVTGPAALGIGLRKEGTSTTGNAFGIVGLSPSPTGTPNVENFVNSQNPSGGGTLLISANDGFTSCPSF